jgi:hypothetical protein
MRLFIPTLGTLLELTSDWTFTLHHEPRNITLFEHLSLTFDSCYWQKKLDDPVVTIPKGTLLKIDRIFIRNGMSDYDSVTFSAPDIKVASAGYWAQRDPKAKKTKRAVRFWAKLEDANKIEADIVT